MLIQLSRFFHLMGLIYFVGGSVAAGVVNRLAASDAAGSPALDRAQVQLGRLANWGAVFLFASGLAAMIFEGLGFSQLLDLHLLWLWAMIVGGLGATALNGIATKQARLLAKGGLDTGAQATARMKINRLRGALLALVIAILVAAVKRG